MARYVLQIPDGEGAAVVQAVCATYGYQPVVNGQANPVSPNEFAIQQVVKWLMGVTAAFRGQQAAATARQTAEAWVEANVMITPSIEAG